MSNAGNFQGGYVSSVWTNLEPLNVNWGKSVAAAKPLLPDGLTIEGGEELRITRVEYNGIQFVRTTRRGTKHYFKRIRQR